MNTVTRKKIVEIVRLLEEWRDWGDNPNTPSGSVMWSPLSDYEKATLDQTIKILKGYLRVLIMIGQFRITLIAFFSHYPELFGEQDDDGPFG